MDFVSVEIHDPANERAHIDGIWCVLSVDENGNEGVVAAPLASGDALVTMPLITSDPQRLEFLRSTARIVSKLTRKRLILVRFETRRHVEEL
jgi:hypothetical protein